MTSWCRVAAIPVGPAGADPEDLWREVEAGLAGAAAAGAALAVLPELTVLPYVAGANPARWRHLAEPAAGPTARRMLALSRRHGLAVLFGLALAESGAALPLNAALLAQPDGTLTRIAAKHRLPPPLPGEPFGEADHFRAGPAAWPAVRVGLPGGGSLRVAGLVCYDRRFPASWDAAAAEADLVAILVAGPAPGDPPGFFEAELSGHARRCRVAAVAAARYGTERVLGRPVRHDGESLVVGQDGHVLAARRPGAPGPVVVALTPDPLRLSLPIA
ncbi:nitrilase-related carbon-nitrogen hydrolase [Methylobacterium nonmethylotrophicum]|uniref:Carbon-nitrogen hydrolase family protein n=1 Tax=Methylobacterium nonmethylotrophicum TaxID=1141884 RepID=A0A4Z0NGW7_9HYPH|nr:nitrilase-related carbon-nitrogen hydrolase [Methylobacterium nonmethylotrophicum]TGD95339.1 carbon-nitrogen hydrolase family protein [Methylobacterium nonmethylotrophicum]